MEKQTLDKIIHEHLMSMDFDTHSNNCTPTERALFFRMKDVAINYANQQTQELQRQVEELNQLIDDDLQYKTLLDKYTKLKEAADEYRNATNQLCKIMCNGYSKNELLKAIKVLADINANT